MADSAQTSFIPKRPLDASINQRPKSSHSFGLLNVIATFILLASLIFYGGAWFYQTVLDDEINRPCEPVAAGSSQVSRCGLIASLERERQNLDQDTILLFQRLDHKFKIASDILADHLDLLPVFKMLEQLTLPSIYFDSFSFTADKGITMEGKAISYEDIAVQTQIFSADKGRIQSFIFSDLDTDTDGVVIFKLTMILEPALLSYSKNLNLTDLNPLWWNYYYH